MQLRMIGIGRIGPDMVRRLLKTRASMGAIRIAPKEGSTRSRVWAKGSFHCSGMLSIYRPEHRDFSRYAVTSVASDRYSRSASLFLPKRRRASAVT
jgi:hypothetical protein